MEAGISMGAAAYKAADVRKHSKYDVKCTEGVWLRTFSYGNTWCMGGAGVRYPVLFHDTGHAV